MVRDLEQENSRLKQELSTRIVIESFEGERLAFPGGLDSNQEQWCDELDEDGACPVEPGISFGAALKDRSTWLVALLLMQSASGFILAKNEALLANHPMIIYYLTMLVGAGGNAGNVSCIIHCNGHSLFFYVIASKRPCYSRTGLRIAKRKNSKSVSTARSQNGGSFVWYFVVCWILADDVVPNTST